MTYFVETSRYSVVNVSPANILFSVNGDFLRCPGNRLIPILNCRPTRQGDMDNLVSCVNGNGQFGCE